MAHGTYPPTCSRSGSDGVGIRPTSGYGERAVFTDSLLHKQAGLKEVHLRDASALLRQLATGTKIHNATQRSTVPDAVATGKKRNLREHIAADHCGKAGEVEHERQAPAV